jgi:hypothetical protein
MTAVMSAPLYYGVLAPHAPRLSYEVTSATVAAAT